MSKAILALRLLLGLAFLVFGLNGFMHFFAPPPPTAEGARAFAMALNATGYVMPLMSFFEVVAAVMLLSGRFVPLALALLAPILVNIIAFHVFLDPAGMGGGVVFTAIAIFLAWSYRSSYAGMLAAAAQPTLAPRPAVAAAS